MTSKSSGPSSGASSGSSASVVSQTNPSPGSNSMSLPAGMKLPRRNSAGRPKSSASFRASSVSSASISIPQESNPSMDAMQVTTPNPLPHSQNRSPAAASDS